MRNLLTIALLCVSAITFAQSKKKQDIAAIKEMCGCYEVKFNFAETFSPDDRYEFYDNYTSGGLEWVQLVEDQKDKISMQHLLIVGEEMIVKHWRQDWLYENTDLYVYDKDNSWKYTKLSPKEVKGQWTQKVYQVDDGLRYEGSATWIHADGKSFWEATSDSPLPRREYTKRNDYNVMMRTNRHELTGFGWIHEQDNDKLLRYESGDELIAEEKGYNTYTKVADEKCKAAQDYWKKNEAYWADVRTVWDEIFAEKRDLTFKGKVDDQVLFEKMFALAAEVTEQDKYDSQAVKEQVKEIILMYQD
jgi:hypothetical protein